LAWSFLDCRIWIGAFSLAEQANDDKSFFTNGRKAILRRFDVTTQVSYRLAKGEETS
jgi:hypothetical protein